MLQHSVRAILRVASILLLFHGVAAAQTLLGPTPYLSRADSPFAGTAGLQLEDFEDGLFNTVGVSADRGGVTSVVYGPSSHDSVDADDGVIDGWGLNGDSYFAYLGSAGITFTFDAAILGSLPTRVGIVWTDGGGQTTFEAFDPSGALLGTIGPVSIATAGFGGQTDEDRFFGITHSAGIQAIKIRNSSGGIEVDHLQYGPFAGRFSVSGSGCAGSNGTPTLAGIGLPSLGSSLFALRLEHAPVSAPTTLLLGLVDSAPVDLGFLGAPGCNLLVTPALGSLAGAADLNGEQLQSLPIPNDPGLVNLAFFLQWVVVDAAANSLGLTMTNRGIGLVQ